MHSESEDFLREKEDFLCQAKHSIKLFEIFTNLYFQSLVFGFEN